MNLLSARLRFIPLLAALFLSASGCKHKPADPFTNGWTKMEFAPLPLSDYREQGVQSSCLFHLGEAQNQVLITRTQFAGFQTRGKIWTLAIANGILHSQDHGEWGGDLWWTDAQGGKRTNLLHTGIDALVPFRGKVVVFSGFLFNDLMEHPVYLYTPAAGGPGSLNNLNDLHSIPFLVTRSKDDLLILTHQGIVRMDANFQLTRLTRIVLSADEVEAATALARDGEGRIYLGLRGFVARITPTQDGSTEEWFTQPGCLTPQ